MKRLSYFPKISKHNFVVDMIIVSFVNEILNIIKRKPMEGMLFIKRLSALAFKKEKVLTNLTKKLFTTISFLQRTTVQKVFTI